MRREVVAVWTGVINRRRTVELFLLRYVIGPENWRHSLNQSDLKPTLRTGHLRFPMLHPRDH